MFAIVDECRQCRRIGLCIAQYIVELLKVTVRFKSIHTANGVDASGDGSHNFICWRDGRISDAFVLKFNRVAETLAVCVSDVAAMRAIMLRRSG